MLSEILWMWRLRCHCRVSLFYEWGNGGSDEKRLPWNTQLGQNSKTHLCSFCFSLLLPSPVWVLRAKGGGWGGAGCLLLKFRDVVMGHCLENRVNRLHEHNINSSARFVATWNFEILLRSILPHNSQVIGVNFYFIPMNCENLCLENGLKSIHVMEYTSAPSKYELLICATTKTNLKIIMLSKGHQTKNVCTIWSIYRECIWYVSINIKFQKMQINPLW